MHLVSSLLDSQSLITVTGSVEALDVPELRGRLLDALERDPGDVLLDMRQVAPVDDGLIAALTAVRSRAKHLRRRIVVIDAVDGMTTLTLRQHGMHLRFPVYPDPAGASAGLAGDRAARERLTLAPAAAGPVDEPPPGGAQQGAPDMQATGHAKQALWPVTREVRPGGPRRP